MIVPLAHCNKKGAYFVGSNPSIALALVTMGIWLTLLFTIRGSICRGVFGGLAGTSALDLMICLSLYKKTTTSLPTTTLPSASVASPIIEVQFPEDVPDTLYLGASAVSQLSPGESNAPTLNFLLSIIHARHFFTLHGKADEQWTLTRIDLPISTFSYVVTRTFYIEALTMAYSRGDTREAITHAMGLFLYGCRTVKSTISLPRTLIMPFGTNQSTPGHCYLIFLEEEREEYHISLVDQLGADGATNGYGQKDIREGIAEALVQFRRSAGTSIRYHYAPAHGEPLRCGLYLQLNIDRAIRTIEDGGRIYERLNEIFISADDKLEGLIASNQALAQKWLKSHSHRHPKSLEKQNENLGRELLE